MATAKDDTQQQSHIVGHRRGGAEHLDAAARQGRNSLAVATGQEDYGGNNLMSMSIRSDLNGV